MFQEFVAVETALRDDEKGLDEHLREYTNGELSRLHNACLMVTSAINSEFDRRARRYESLRATLDQPPPETTQ